MARLRASVLIALAAAAVLALCAPAASSAAGCEGANVKPKQPRTVEAARQATVCLLNRARARQGLDRVGADKRLRRAGDEHSRDMARHNYFSHTGRDGSDHGERMRREGYRWERAGEVLYWGTGALTRPKRVVRAWMESSGHRAVILTPEFRDVGIGLVAASPFKGSRGATYTGVWGRR